jgi:hypothetical protein
MEKVYISGKITGLPISEVEKKFNDAEMLLLKNGYSVANPMSLPHLHNKSWVSYMKEDIAAMMKCEAILLLPDYIESKGALIEYDLANKLGFKIMFLVNNEIIIAPF